MQVRPLLDTEKARGAAACVEAPSTTVVQLPPRRDASEPYRFDFDRVYKMSNPGAQAQILSSAYARAICHALAPATTPSQPAASGAWQPLLLVVTQHRSAECPCMCTGRQMFAEVVQPLLSRFIQGFNTTVSRCSRLATPLTSSYLQHCASRSQCC